MLRDGTTCESWVSTRRVAERAVRADCSSIPVAGRLSHRPEVPVSGRREFNCGVQPVEIREVRILADVGDERVGEEAREVFDELCWERAPTPTDAGDDTLS